MNMEICKRCDLLNRQQIIECRFMFVNEKCGKFLVFPQFCNHPEKCNVIRKYSVAELPLSIVEQINKQPYKKLRPLTDLTYCIQQDRFKEIPYKIEGMKEWFASWFDNEYIFKGCPYYVEHLIGSYHESRNMQKVQENISLC